MTPSEQAFADAMEAAGFTVLKRGWPDFMVVGPDGATFAVEVKSGLDQTSLPQEAMHAALVRSGFPVYLVRAPETASQAVEFAAPRGLREAGSTPASPTIPATHWIRSEDFQEDEW